MGAGTKSSSSSEEMFRSRDRFITVRCPPSLLQLEERGFISGDMKGVGEKYQNDFVDK